MTAQKVDDEALAALVERDRTTIVRLRAGKYRPSHELMARIAAATNGAVQPNDFFELAQDKAA